MKKGTCLMLLWCLCVSAFAKAQQPPSTSISQTPLVADAFYGVDDFKNLYYGEGNVFFKRPLDSKSKAQQFYDVQLGDLTSVDLINPLKILLFYKDTQTVVFLDNRLNESQRIVLSELKPYRYFDFVGLAGERRLWLFNTDADRVELYDYINSKLIVSSPVIKEEVHQMLTDYNFCHLVAAHGIATYNNYGSKVSQLETSSVTMADYDFERLVLLQGDVWSLYGFNRENRFEVISNSLQIDGNESPKSLYLKNGKLYLYRHTRLSVYDINQN